MILIRIHYARGGTEGRGAEDGSHHGGGWSAWLERWKACLFKLILMQSFETLTCSSASLHKKLDWTRKKECYNSIM